MEIENWANNAKLSTTNRNHAADIILLFFITLEMQVKVIINMPKPQQNPPFLLIAHKKKGGRHIVCFQYIQDLCGTAVFVTGIEGEIKHLFAAFVNGFFKFFKNIFNYRVDFSRYYLTKVFSWYIIFKKFQTGVLLIWISGKMVQKTYQDLLN